MEEKFHVEGMTCLGCVGRVQNALVAAPNIKSVEIELASGTASIKSIEAPSMEELQNALAPLSHYTIKRVSPAHYASDTTDRDKTDRGNTDRENAAWKKFWPLILIGLFLLAASLLGAWDSPTPMRQGMELFMSGFFLVFSFFKFLDLRGFVRSYTMYDLLAKRITVYAWIYPFIELALGCAWAVIGGTFEVALITAILMGFGAIGVIRAVSRKQAIQCACLGTVFKVPMTNVTIIEDLLMVIMSLFFLFP
jgi:cation transport ATPase